jgi:hypothetical protein
MIASPIMKPAFEPLIRESDWLTLSPAVRATRLCAAWRAYWMRWRPADHWDDFAVYTVNDWNRLVRD